MTKTDQNLVNLVFQTAMEILEDSQLHNSSLWPKNGFFSGWREPKKADAIGLVINANHLKEWYGLQFNIWGKNLSRMEKQNYQISLIFDQATKNGLTFNFDFDLAAYKFNWHDAYGKILFSRISLSYNFST